MKIVSKAWLRLVIADLIAASPGAGHLHGLYVGLITSPVGSVTPDTVRADVTEADFTGYARQAISAWGGPYDGIDGATKVEGGAHLFQPSDAVTPNMVTGIAYFDASTAGNLVAVDPLPAAYPLPDANSGLPVVPVAALPFNIDMGTGVEV